MVTTQIPIFWPSLESSSLESTLQHQQEHRLQLGPWTSLTWKIRWEISRPAFSLNVDFGKSLNHQPDIARYNQILTIKHGLLENPASMDDFPRNISWSFVAHSFFPGPCSLARLQCPRESFGKWSKSDQYKWLEKSGKIDPIKMLNYLSLRLQKILLNDGH